MIFIENKIPILTFLGKAHTMVLDSMNIINNIIISIGMNSLFLKGQNFARNYKFNEAIDAFEAALKKSPENAFVHLHKGLAHSNSNDYKEAIASIERAIKINPSNAVFWVFLGLVHFDYCKFELANNAFEHAKKTDPAYELPNVCIGLCNLAEGDVTNGYNLIVNNSELHHSIDEPRLLLLCENILFRAGVVLPEKKITFSTTIDPFWIVLLNILLNILGLKKLASLLFKKKQEDLEYTEKINTFRKCFDSGKYQEALKIIESIDNEIDEQLLFAHAMTLYKTKNYKDATKLFEKLSTQDSRNYLFFYYMGLCAIALEDQRKALNYFNEMSKTLHPNLAKKRLQQVYDFYNETKKH